MKYYVVTIQMKATEQYFPVVLFIIQVTRKGAEIFNYIKKKLFDQSCRAAS